MRIPGVRANRPCFFFSSPFFVCYVNPKDLLVLNEDVVEVLFVWFLVEINADGPYSNVGSRAISWSGETSSGRRYYDNG